MQLYFQLIKSYVKGASVDEKKVTTDKKPVKTGGI